MPTYEYVCTECQTRMEIRATIAEKEKGLTVICPKCGGKKTAQVFSSFMIPIICCVSFTGINIAAVSFVLQYR